MRNAIHTILRIMARAVLYRHRTKIIAITGSMGKTTAKNALITILQYKNHYRVRGTQNLLRNEVGIPLTIIGLTQSPGHSLLRWVMLLGKWLWAVTFSWRYPDILVLEFGVDHPGDMEYVTRLAPPDVGVVTAISSVHTEHLGDVRGVAREKSVLITALAQDGLAVLNGDNHYTRAMANKSSAPVLMYGMAEQSRDTVDVFASDIRSGGMSGVSFKVNYDGNSVPVRLPHVIASHMISPILAAITVALRQGMHLVDIAQALEGFTPIAGRMRLLAGINDSIIIDDTYNAPLDAMRSAIGATATMPAQRCIVVLGDMLELGAQETALHKSLADDIESAQIPVVITVGVRMEHLFQELVVRKFDTNNLYHLDSPMEAGALLQELIQPQDCVLIKGSQDMRMEQVTAQILADTQNARDVLCRQDTYWIKKSFKQP